MLKKHRKKGSLFIEQLIVFPIFIIVVWLIAQVIIYSYSNNQLATVSNDIASMVSHHLRGNPSLVNFGKDTSNASGVYSLEEVLGDDISESLKNEALNRSYNVLYTNTFVEFATDNGTRLDRDDFLNDETITLSSNPEECTTFLKDSKKTLCVYLEMDSSGDGNSASFQVVTRIKGPFRIIGNFLNVLGENAKFGGLSVYGNSSYPVDMPGRFQYYK